MALLADVETSLEQTLQKSDSPVDLVHLARYTLGNKKLEHEVLELFIRQSAQYFDRLKLAKTEKEWHEAAHTIKGSAKGIGAWRVASKAEALERFNDSVPEQTKLASLASLEQSICDAKVFIEELLNEA